MDLNFHYYVTYTAACQAGFPPEDALTVARAARYVDECLDVTVQDVKRLLLENINDSLTWNYKSLLKVAAIWIPFHFLPGNYAAIRADIDPTQRELIYPCTHLICGPESPLTECLVEAAKSAYTEEENRTKGLLRIGIAMHTLADTFAHQGFAGIPHRNINGVSDVKHFVPNPADIGEEVLKKVIYGFLDYSYAPTKNSFGYLGHGRIGTIVDVPCETLHYRAHWHGCRDPYITRCNPLEFCCAYLQMTQAMRYILGEAETFQNRLERWTLVDRTGPLWKDVQKIIRAFLCSDTDSRLADVWRLYVDDALWPERYRPLTEDAALEPLFREAAGEQRRLVWDNCAPWRDYAVAHGGKPPA